ncbi:hypothetical protein [Congregibacter sp.]|uniref:hypothetical protein n=1 Tax=Congregibacter sp. TaxID=2744308 RepID=UPI00385D9DAD
MSTQTKLRTLTEFVGAVSIVLSLVFVGLELRHANNVAEADSVQQINAMYLELSVGAHQNADLVRAIAEANDTDFLSVAAGFRNLSTLNITETAWKSFDRGILEEEHYLAYLTDGCTTVFPDGGMEAVLTPPGYLPWAEYKRNLSKRFVDAFEAHCQTEFERI